MKSSNIFKILTLLLSFAVVVSCVKDDEFSTPDLTDMALDIPADRIVTIQSLRSQLSQEIIDNGNSILTFDTDENPDNDLYVEGYVISSDEGGNFFEELLIQNAPTSPVAGVKVLIDVNPLFTAYEKGRRVVVRLEGLSIGLDSGVLTLGIRSGNELEKIAESQQDVYIKRDAEVATIEPKVLMISEFDSVHTNQYVRLMDAQFNRNEVLGDDRKTFASEPEDEFDGERILESCAEGTSVIFSTSTFADFKSLLLPQGRGMIDGVLTYNFFGEDFNFVVNDPTSIMFDSTDRCDPAEVDCGLASATGSNVLFEEFFETQTENQPISGNGWTNYVEAGTETWEAYTSGGTNASLGISARMGSFQSGDDSSIGWLITPQINLDAQDGETIEFKTSNSFSDGSTLEFLFSSDWDGNPDNISSANWASLPAAYIVQDSDFFGDWLDSGTVDLSCIEGSGYFAFKYVGSGDADFDGTYELDEIEIKSN